MTIHHTLNLYSPVDIVDRASHFLPREVGISELLLITI